MTRDEAMAKVFEAIHDGDLNGPMLVDALAALGVLKLDEPVSPSMRARVAIANAYGDNGYLTLELVMGALSAAGLRIVEAE
jgi:hypothetical protein